jgi:3,4-dihydroxy 2-butanone 4-phosphate synthase/GTP cyclohydrolase II
VTGLPAVAEAVAEFAAGRPVLVVDAADRENEGDLIFAAEKATPELMGFLIRHTSGFVCAALTEADCDRLALPPMCRVNQDRRGTAYAVTVDARSGVSTGISAADRCRTVRLLADPATGPDELARPGHVVPLRARPGGVLRRPGHTEAGVDLARLAGLRPAAVLCEVVNEDGSMSRMPQLTAFAERHGIRLITIADLIEHRRLVERQVDALAEARVPTAHGTFRAVGYRSLLDGSDHVAMVFGDVTGEEVLVRLHSECLTGDVFGSLRCDCGAQLDAALAAVAAAGRGVVVYLRGHEGRGIGLLSKLRAYQLQDDGQDTVQANLSLGLPADARDYRIGAEILTDLGVGSVRLLTNNPAKEAGLAAAGVAVLGRIPLPVRVTEENARYLATKRDRMGHTLPPVLTGVPGAGVPGAGAPVDVGVGGGSAAGVARPEPAERPGSDLVGHAAVGGIARSEAGR